MGFESFLGNRRVKENLRASLARGRISHFYLISGPEGSGKHTLARLMAAGILCRESDKPCLRCPSCRKVMADTHPDVITMDDPEKKTVTVELVRQAVSDVYIRPNEGSHKIYLFPRAQDLQLPGQNALLKVLEEPPHYGVFLLLTDNPERLLPTIRSRCTALALSALEEGELRQALKAAFPEADALTVAGAISRSGGFLGQAQQLLAQGLSLPPQTSDFVQAYSRRDSLALLQLLVPMEKSKREQLLLLLQQWRGLLEEALVFRSGFSAAPPAVQQLGTARSAKELMQAVSCLQKAIDYTQSNVSVAAVCGYLTWALR